MYIGDTGITSYQDHVVFFKANQMYELYGYILRILNRLIDEKSKYGVLFREYKLFRIPRTVSETNLDNITKATGIGDGRKYYVSVNGSTYIYDTWQQTFMPYIEGEVIEFAKIIEIYLLKQIYR